MTNPDALAQLADTIRVSQACAAVTPRITTYDGRHTLSVGVSCDIFGYPTYPRGNVFSADGAALLVRGASLKMSAPSMQGTPFSSRILLNLNRST